MSASRVSRFTSAILYLRFCLAIRVCDLWPRSIGAICTCDSCPCFVSAIGKCDLYLRSAGAIRKCDSYVRYYSDIIVRVFPTIKPEKKEITPTSPMSNPPSLHTLLTEMCCCDHSFLNVCSIPNGIRNRLLSCEVATMTQQCNAVAHLCSSNSYPVHRIALLNLLRGLQLCRCCV